MTRKFMFLLLGLGATGCAADQNTFVVDQHELKLMSNSGQCQMLDLQTQSVTNLLIPTPCRIHRTAKGEVRIHEQSGKRYFLLESSTPHRELPNDCETHLQSVMLFQGTVTPSKITDLVAACPPFQWDTKVFTGLFN